jgi:hypothetical protein
MVVAAATVDLGLLPAEVPLTANRSSYFGALLRGSVFLLLLGTVVGSAHGLQWIELSPTGGPPTPRDRHTAVYDPVSNRMIVFGGRDSGFNALDDVWILTHPNGLGGTPEWTKLSPTGDAPGKRILHSAVYNPLSNRMIVFGGRDETNTTVSADVWVLEHANGLDGTPNWIMLSPTGGPPDQRYRHAAVYDVSTDRMIIFGGAGAPYKNDVWVLEQADGLGGSPNWTELSPTGGPPPGRSSMGATYDPTSNRLTVFGGFNFGLLNDVWVLDHANGLGGTGNWTELSPTGEPPTARTEHTAVYDPQTNGMLVFAGDDNSGPLDELWLLSNANGLGGTPNWMLLSPTGGPPPERILHSAVFDENGNRMTVFGGIGEDRLNDVWVLTDAFARPSASAPAMSSVALGALTLMLFFIGVAQLARLRRT